MTKAELPPLPEEAVEFAANVHLGPKLTVHRDALLDYGLACYRAGMMRAAEIADLREYEHIAAQAIREEAEKVK